jgi:MFS family permease
MLPETRGVRPEIISTSVSNFSLTWYRNPGLWVVAVLQGINRFVFAGVLAATIALLVQDQMSSIISPAVGVATLTGVLMAGRTLMSVVAAPLSGTLSDRLGSRWVVTVGGLVIGALSMLLLGYTSPVSILVGVLLGAVAGGSIQALVTALTGDLVGKRQRGRAIGLLHTAGDLGSAAGPLVAYGLLVWVGLSGVYVLSAVLFLVGAAIALWYSRSQAGKGSMEN